METALKICKRLHSYLYAGQFHGKVTGVYDKRLDMETPFGLIAVVQRECLKPFSCLVGSLTIFICIAFTPLSGTPLFLLFYRKNKENTRKTEEKL